MYGWRFPSSRPVGDGILTDLGPAESNYQFVIDLGYVDLLRSNHISYTLRDLPEVEFALGFMVYSFSDSHEAIYDQKPLYATLGIHLVDAEGRAVIEEHAPASSWIWSGSSGDLLSSFIYRRGRHVEEPLGGGGVSLKRVGIKASEGWGTYFTPLPSESYVLTVDIQDPTTTPRHVTAELKALGGGWK